MRPPHSSILRCWGVTERLLAASEMRTSSLITNDHSARCYRGKDMKIGAALIRFYFFVFALFQYLSTKRYAICRYLLLSLLGLPSPKAKFFS